jgi:hypothetical protein
MPFNVDAHPALDGTCIVLKISILFPCVVYTEGLVAYIHQGVARGCPEMQEDFRAATGKITESQDPVDLMAKMRAL